MSPDFRQPFDAVWPLRARLPIRTDEGGDDRFVLAYSRLDRGLVRDAWEILAELLSEPRARGAASRSAAATELVYYPDAGRVEDTEAALRTDRRPDAHFWLGALAARAGRWERVEAEADSLEVAAREAAAGGDTLTSRYRRAFAEAVRAFGELEGDQDAEAALRLRRVLPALPAVGEGAEIQRFVRFTLGRLALERGNLLEAARYFESFSLFDVEYTAPVQHWLGRSHEALGDTAAALLHHGRLHRWWDGCDSELLPLREESARALERLSLESLQG